jgi:hypothetical protein
MFYADFKEKAAHALRQAGKPLTWVELRTAATLPRAYPSSQWVQRMEQEIGLLRRRGPDGIVRWQLRDVPLGADASSG